MKPRRSRWTSTCPSWMVKIPTVMPFSDPFHLGTGLDCLLRLFSSYTCPGNVSSGSNPAPNHELNPHGTRREESSQEKHFFPRTTKRNAKRLEEQGVARCSVVVLEGGRAAPFRPSNPAEPRKFPNNPEKETSWGQSAGRVPPGSPKPRSVRGGGNAVGRKRSGLEVLEGRLTSSW
ncbi:hypothetical protein LZ30DRAFT_421492 [Colletotrichum cereale]|nr:hypothetical protein LZ30DRAFT_421492 [Colletotrichum cereale]